MLMIGLEVALVNTLLSYSPNFSLNRPHGQVRDEHLLPAVPTEASLNCLPTSRLHIPIFLHFPTLVLYFDFFLLDCQIRAHIAARDFPAVRAMTKMTPGLGEEFIVGDGDADGAAKTRRGNGFGELRSVMGVGVSGEFGLVGHG
jgi:hypothetical protein